MHITLLIFGPMIGAYIGSVAFKYRVRERKPRTEYRGVRMLEEYAVTVNGHQYLVMRVERAEHFSEAGRFSLKKRWVFVEFKYWVDGEPYDFSKSVPGLELVINQLAD